MAPFTIVISGATASAIEKPNDSRLVLIKYELDSRYRLDDKDYMIKLMTVRTWPESVNNDPLVITAPLVPYQYFCGVRKPVIGTSIEQGNSFVPINDNVRFLDQRGWLGVEHFSGEPVAHRLIASLVIFLRIVPASSVRES